MRLLLTLSLVAGSLAQLSATPVVIDAFGTLQDVPIANGGTNPTTNANGVVAPDAVGGNRYISVTRQQSFFSADLFVSSGVAGFSTGPGVTGSALITWDGSAGAAFDPTGLGGVDLTSLGSNVMVQLGLQADQSGGLISVIIYTDATHFSTATVSTVGGSSFTTDSILFSNFVASGSGGGADFTNVGAIQLAIDDVSPGTPLSLDTQFNFLAATAAPEPSSLLTVAAGAALVLISRRKRKASQKPAQEI